MDNGKCMEECDYGYSTVQKWKNTALNTCITNITNCLYVRKLVKGDKTLWICYDLCPEDTIQASRTSDKYYFECVDRCLSG